MGPTWVDTAFAAAIAAIAAWSAARLRLPGDRSGLFGATAATACHAVTGLGVGSLFLSMAGWPG
jgi:hypothetical protein